MVSACEVNVRADAERGVLQTLLVTVGCGGAKGLLPGCVLRYPGEHSLKLGTPGLYYAAPLELVSDRANGGVLLWRLDMPGVGARSRFGSPLRGFREGKPSWMGGRWAGAHGLSLHSPFLEEIEPSR